MSFIIRCIARPEDTVEVDEETTDSFKRIGCRPEFKYEYAKTLWELAPTAMDEDITAQITLSHGFLAYNGKQITPKEWQAGHFTFTNIAGVIEVRRLLNP